MSTQMATAVHKDWAAFYPYLAKQYRREGGPNVLIRSFSKWHAIAKLTIVALIGAAVLGTHAYDCFRLLPVSAMVLLGCLLYPSRPSQNHETQEKTKLSFFFKSPDNWQLFQHRANLGNYEFATRSITAPYYVRRLRLVHESNDTANCKSGWNFDDPAYLDECHFVWEEFGVDQLVPCEADGEGYRFVDFAGKRF